MEFLQPPLINRRHERQTAAAGRFLAGRTPGAETRVLNLSGGNQQKVVLGKWLAMQPKVMILDEPTRGIDVGAKAEIYRLMRELADGGAAVMIISSDMEEVLNISDRIAVMHEGEIAGMLERADCGGERDATRVRKNRAAKPICKSLDHLRMKKEIGIVGLLLVLCAVTGSKPRFFSEANLPNQANFIGLLRHLQHRHGYRHHHRRH